MQTLISDSTLAVDGATGGASPASDFPSDVRVIADAWAGFKQLANEFRSRFDALCRAERKGRGIDAFEDYRMVLYGHDIEVGVREIAERVRTV